MNHELIIVFVLLGLCVGLFMINKPRMDVVALIVIIALPLLGIVSVPEALAGFADPSVVLIAALFVIGEGLVQTGVTHRMGDWLMKRAGHSETRLLVLLMLSVAILGSVMSSTGVVAIFIPVVLGLAGRLGVSPGRLMMPLSFAGLISGMQTLVATPPNMVVDSALKREGLEGFGFFTFTPVGVVVLVLGIGYMLMARRWLTVRSDGNNHSGARRGFRDLINDYQLNRRQHRLLIRGQSPLAGRMLQDLSLRTQHCANVVAIERAGRFSHEIIPPNAAMELKTGDVLFIDRAEDAGNLTEMCRDLVLEELPLPEGYLSNQARVVGMAEVLLPPDSSLVGKTILEMSFRRKHGLNVVGLRRDRQPLEGQLLEEKLKMGDILLVIGPWKSIRRLQEQPQEFIVLNLPAEVDDVAAAPDRAPQALLSLAVMIVLMVTGVVPNVVAALLACLMMGALRCIDLSSAYKSIHWQSLVLIAGMIPFALSLERTGGIELAVTHLMDLFGGAGPRLLLAGLFVLTAVTGLFISNTATAVLMAPVALSVARHLDASPLPFALTVALAASAAFMTPVSSPVNTLVLGPGRYRFIDFVKVGVPFTVLVMIITVMMVPWLFPL